MALKCNLARFKSIGFGWGNAVRMLYLSYAIIQSVDMWISMMCVLVG